MPTFEVETGTGSATANAYCTEAFADNYHSCFGNPASWVAATTAAKEDAIRQATRFLDVQFHNRWRGFRGSKDQALDHPRRALVDTDEWTRDSDAVAIEVQDATAIMALKVVDGETLLPDTEAADRGVLSERVKVGPIEEEKRFTDAKANFKRRSLAEGILRPLLQRRNKRVRA